METKNAKEGLTIADLRNLAYDTVCKQANYERKEAPILMKEDIQFRHLVGAFLGQRMKGRPTPVRSKGIVPCNEAQRLFNKSLFHNCYPKNIGDDKKKLKFLQQKLSQGAINNQIFLDLANVLDIKQTQVMKALNDTVPPDLFSPVLGEN